MQAGRLDRMITIQRSTPTNGDDGQPVESWATVGDLRRPASMRPVSGEERFDAPQYVANDQIEFRIRYATVVAELTPLDRIIYPAFTAAEIADSPMPDVETRRIHDIIAVHEIGRREGLQIITARRSDVLT